jgi:hypothetical protein
VASCGVAPLVLRLKVPISRVAEGAGMGSGDNQAKEAGKEESEKALVQGAKSFLLHSLRRSSRTPLMAAFRRVDGPVGRSHCAWIETAPVPA